LTQSPRRALRRGPGESLSQNCLVSWLSFGPFSINMRLADSFWVVFGVRALSNHLAFAVLGLLLPRCRFAAAGWPLACVLVLLVAGFCLFLPAAGTLVLCASNSLGRPFPGLHSLCGWDWLCELIYRRCASAACHARCGYGLPILEYGFSGKSPYPACVALKRVNPPRTFYLVPEYVLPWWGSAIGALMTGSGLS